MLHQIPGKTLIDQLQQQQDHISQTGTSGQQIQQRTYFTFYCHFVLMLNSIKCYAKDVS